MDEGERKEIGMFKWENCVKKYVPSRDLKRHQGMKHKNDKGLSGKVSILTASEFSSLVKRCSSICQQVLFLPQGIRSKFGSFDFRGSHRRCSVKKGVLRNFSKLTGRHLCQSLFFNKVAG